MIGQSYLTVPDVARQLRVDPETVRRWIRGGRLPAVRLGKRGRAGYRITRADLDKWLVEQAGSTEANNG